MRDAGLGVIQLCLILEFMPLEVVMAVHGRGDKKRWEGKKEMIKRRFFFFFFLWRYYRKKIALNKGKKKKEPIVTLKLGIMLWS